MMKQLRGEITLPEAWYSSMNTLTLYFFGFLWISYLCGWDKYTVHHRAYIWVL